MLNSLLESRRFNHIYIENDQEVRNKNMAPLIVEGGSLFKKTAFFLNSIIIGPNKDEKEGTLAFKNNEFMGFNGEKWISFSKNDVWTEKDGIVYIEGKKIGINKIGPKKTLEVGGDVSIDKKLFVRDDVTMETGYQLGDNQGKKRRGYVRFWDNIFEGYDGEKWVKFGGETVSEIKEIPQVNLEKVDKLKLISCPLTFLNNGLETHFYYDNDKSEFCLARLNKSFETINMENLYMGNLKLQGDITFEEGGRKTIKNVSDPVVDSEVATKRYVDQMCSGLQDYIVTDFLLFGDDCKLEGDDLEINGKVGEIGVGKLVFILDEKHSELFSVIEMGEKIKLNGISVAQPPAKLLVKDGKYGNSEYIIFSNNNFMQLNGMESVEYISPLLNIGKEIRLKYDKNIFTDELSIKDKSIQNNHLSDDLIESRNIKNESILSSHLLDNIIESRHLANKVITSNHIQHKSIGDVHMRDGFLRNHHFTPGIISEKELGNECVGLTSLKSGIILQKHLTKGCVMGDNIGDSEISGKHLEDKLLDTRHFNERIILGEHLSNNLIKNNHLGEKSVDNKNLMDNIISSEHLKSGIINKEHLQVNIINGFHIQENSILGTHIKEQTVVSNNLSKNIIKDWHIGEGVIKRIHLEDYIIDGSKLCEKMLEERHFSDNCIGLNNLKKNCVNGNNIMVGVIEDKHLMNYCVKTAKLMDGSVTEIKIAENSVSTSKIKDGSITSDKLKLPFIKISSDPVFTVTQMVNLGETLNLGLNPNYMIPKRREGVVEFMSSVRFGEEGTGQRMEVNMELDVYGDVNFRRNVKINNERLFQIGEIRGIWEKIHLDENFHKNWTKCDGKRVKKSDYPELGEILGEDEFYLPDIKADNIDYYIRIK